MSEQLAGRFFNAFGDPIDGGPEIEGQEVEIGGPSVNPVRRKQPSELIATGIAEVEIKDSYKYVFITTVLNTTITALIVALILTIFPGLA